MKALLCAAMLALALSACASVGGSSQADKISYTCASAGLAMEAVTIASKAGKVNHDQWQIAVKAGEVLSPICSSPTVPTLTDVKMLAISAAAAQLVSIAGSTK